MKIGIGQKILLEALIKGSMAALSEDAQSDTSTLALLIKSIKITVVDNSLTIESGTEHMAIKHSIPITKDNGIVVKENGCVLIPAKELIDWVKVQGEGSTISLVLHQLEKPEVINTLEDMGESDDIDKTKFLIKKIGHVKISSKNLSGTIGKWELDSYDTEHFASVNFKPKAEECFEIHGDKLAYALSSIAFASLQKDYDHVLDSISIQTYEDELYFSTTDTKRCALYKIPKDSVIKLQSKRTLLVPVKIMENITKVIDPKEKIVFSYSEDINRVFISQPNTNIRVSSAEKEKMGKFPSIQFLFKKPYKLLAEISKNTLNSLLINASIVNNSSALFSFNKDEGTFTIKAMSDYNKYKPSVKQTKLENISRNLNICWGVSHLLSGIKAINGDTVQLLIPESLQSVRINGKDDPNFIYFAMVISNKMFDQEIAQNG